MLQSFLAYFGRVFHALQSWHLSLVETTLVLSLVMMCLVSAIASQFGQNIGNYQALQIAKMQAQESLVASKQN